MGNAQNKNKVKTITDDKKKGPDAPKDEGTKKPAELKSGGAEGGFGQLGLQTTQGSVYVKAIQPGSAGSQSRLLVNDQIKEVGGKTILSLADYTSAINGVNANGPVTLKIQRNGLLEQVVVKPPQALMNNVSGFPVTVQPSPLGLVTVLKNLIDSAEQYPEAFQKEVLSIVENIMSQQHFTSTKAVAKKPAHEFKSPTPPTVVDVATQAELISMIQNLPAGHVLRVVGAGHANYQCRGEDEKQVQMIRLTGDFKKIHSITQNSDGEWVVESGAGIHMGACPTPIDGSPPTPIEESLLYLMDHHDPPLSLTITGGITHQTLGGFLSTGSAGGSTMHSSMDTLRGITFIDGTGTVHTATYDPKLGPTAKENEVFNAVGISMGLFGIVIGITLKPKVGHWWVKGTEAYMGYNDSILGPNPNPTPGNKYKLWSSLINPANEYMRINWFCCPSGSNNEYYLNNVQEFHAVQAEPPQGAPDPAKDPYHSTLEDETVAKLASGCIELGGLDWGSSASYGRSFYLWLFTNPNLPWNKPCTFLDWGYNAIPADNHNWTDSYIKVDFTEIWIPISNCDAVIDSLLAAFQKDTTMPGNFAIEIYSSVASPFMLGMSQTETCVRVDPYWFHGSETYESIVKLFWKMDCRAFFAKFWEALGDASLSARYHWGKFMPMADQPYGDAKQVLWSEDILNKRYPQINAWKAYRAKFDPQGKFLTNYWKQQLYIKT